jgi:hypothetical protein
MTNCSGKSAYRTEIIPAHVKPSWRKSRLYLGDAQHGSAQARKKMSKCILRKSCLETPRLFQTQAIDYLVERNARNKPYQACNAEKQKLHRR